MGIREQLLEHLPEILPKDPEHAVSSTTLIKDLRKLISDEYEPATYRWHFSMLAKDSTSPIAKAVGKNGYYLRPDYDQTRSQTEAPATIAILEGLNEFGGDATATPRSRQPEEKFRSLYIRHLLRENQFPVHIEHTTAVKAKAGFNKWKFPDLISVEWLEGEQVGGKFVLDMDMIEVRRSTGVSPFTLSSIELKASLNVSNFREAFFQCVSNSKWAHRAELVIAERISDETLQDELRRLASSYAVTVRVFGIERGGLEQTASSLDIDGWSPQEFEEWISTTGVVPETIYESPLRIDLDWEHIGDLRTQIGVAGGVFEWVAWCIREGVAYPFEAYVERRQFEQKYIPK